MKDILLKTKNPIKIIKKIIIRRRLNKAIKNVEELWGYKNGK